MDDNLYAPPSATPDPHVPLPEIQELASRWSRLFAALIDTLIVLLLYIPVMIAWFAFYSFDLDAFADTELSLMEDMALTLVNLVYIGAVYIGINYKRWASHGQSWGKAALGIRIVDMDGQAVPVNKIITHRYLPAHIASSLPGAAGILSLVDTLFIFRADKRCIHDLIADTQVVNCD